MNLAKNGKGLGVEASIGMLLGGVEVRVVLSASGASESHSMNRIGHRTLRDHPFLNVLCPGR